MWKHTKVTLHDHNYVNDLLWSKQAIALTLVVDENLATLASASTSRWTTLTSAGLPPASTCLLVPRGGRRDSFAAIGGM